MCDVLNNRTKEPAARKLTHFIWLTLEVKVIAFNATHVKMFGLVSYGLHVFSGYGFQYCLFHVLFPLMYVCLLINRA
ncbi:hypothetical protein D3C71_2070530 [compost metagenome]